MFQVPAHLENSFWCFLPTPFRTFPASSLDLLARNTRTMRFEQKLVKPTNLFVDWRCNFQFNICQRGKKQDLTEGQQRPTEIRCLDLWCDCEANGWTILTASELMCRKCYVTSLHLGKGAEKRANIYDWVSPAVLVLSKHWILYLEINEAVI